MKKALWIGLLLSSYLPWRQRTIVGSPTSLLKPGKGSPAKANRIMRYLFLLFSFLSVCSSFGQNRRIDSLSNFIQNHIADDTIKVNALNELSNQYLWIDYYSSIQNADHALKIARQLNYAKGIATALNLKGFCFWAFGDNDLAIEMAMEAATLMEKEHFPTLSAESFLMLSRAYHDLHEDEKARQYVDKANRIALQTRNWQQLSSGYNWLGVIQAVNNKEDSAFYYYDKALQIAEEHAIAKINFPRIISNIGECYLKKDPVLAFSYFNKALLLARETGNKTAEASISDIMGHAFLRSGDHTNAEHYFTSALQLARKLGLRRVVRHVYAGLANLRLEQGNASDAVKYLKNYYEVRDSLLNTSKTRQIVELEARHELENKRQAIKLLEQEKQIQTIWRNVLIVGVLLTSVASLLIYRLQRARTKKTKQLLEVQQLLNNKLKEVDKLKSHFFASISHEFRTPLTLILAPLEEELRKKISGEERESLWLIKRNANRLLDLVNQLLDLSKLEAGKMEMKVKPGNVESFLKILTSSFDSLAQHKQIGFEKNILINKQPLWFDQDKLEKIISNLLANAFKFTPAHGAVTFTASVIESDGKDLLRIIIKDTGSGIPDEEQAHVFSPFYQTKQTIDGVHGGTGIGLSLVNELIKLHNGSIALESRVAIGTTFTIVLPVSKQAFAEDQIVESYTDNALVPSSDSTKNYPDEQRMDEETDQTIPSKDSILVAEDNAELLNFIASKLRNDYTVLTAANGEEALQLAIKIVPNLILSDLMMPKMDGIQLTEKIKTDERTSHIPVILLTAKNEPISRLQGLKTGADDYLTKPFSTEELLVRIINLIEQRKHLAEKFRERTLVPVTPLSEVSMDDKFLLRVKEIVEHHMIDPLFTVEKMAEEINLSRTQLLRKLKALTRLSPNEFIKDLRLKRAADMIRQRTDTITQIGYAVGFNDQSYFTKCFKKQFGVTPTDYSTQFEYEK